MSRGNLVLGSLVAALLLGALGCVDQAPRGSGLRREGVIHGTVRMIDLSTGEVRALDRGCRIEIVSGHQRVKGSTKEGATYTIRVPESGRWPLNLYYKDMVLTTEVGANPYTSVVNLYVEYLGDNYSLRAVSVDPNPHRVK